MLRNGTHPPSSTQGEHHSQHPVWVLICAWDGTSQEVACSCLDISQAPRLPLLHLHHEGACLCQAQGDVSEACSLDRARYTGGNLAAVPWTHSGKGTTLPSGPGLAESPQERFEMGHVLLI